MTTISPTRLEVLRAMSYEEYLTTPEWQVTRKRILKRDHYQCQGCQVSGVMLNIHHYTYERLGCELDTDLVTLCEVCHNHLHRMMQELPKLSFFQKCGVGLGAATLGTIGIEGFLQAPLPAEIGVLVGAFFLAKNSPAIYGWLKERVPAEVMAWLGLGSAPTEKKGLAWVNAWLGFPQKQQQFPTEEDIDAYLALHPELQEASDDEDNDWADEETPSLSLKPTNLFCFSELLKTGWRPSWKEIFVGRTMEGKNIFVPATKLCHIAIAGKTGGGKGSLMRLIMVQLCYIGAHVLLLNPHYMRWVVADDGPDFDEDWSPFEGNHRTTGKPYLQASPIETAEFPAIDFYLEWAVEKLLQKRKTEGRTGGVRFRPYFIVIDEWPSILGDLGKRASTRLGKLLREGRKFGIFVMVASQDFQVKTIGVEGEGSVRKCLLTVFYMGGDPTTAKELLYPEGSKVSIPETKLGKGTIMMRCTGTDNEPILALVPFVDNESVYLLLGPSTFIHPRAEERTTDDLEDSHVSLSPTNVSHFERTNVAIGETGESVKPLLKPSESSESQVKSHEVSESISPEDEITIVRTAIALQQANGKVTREDIKAALQWNNKKHWIVKAVCDKYGIATQGGK